MEHFKTWLDRIHKADKEFAYRTIYSAYLAAATGHVSKGMETSSRRHSDGTFEIDADGQAIVLADDTEREALASYMIQHYCRDSYPDMHAWEKQQHAWYVQDLDNWYHE